VVQDDCPPSDKDVTPDHDVSSNTWFCSPTNNSASLRFDSKKITSQSTQIVGVIRSSDTVVADCEDMPGIKTNCSPLRILNACKAVPSSSHHVTADVPGIETNCSLQVADARMDILDIVTGRPSDGNTFHSGNRESRVDVYVTETQSETSGTGHNSTVLHDILDNNVTDMSVVPESLEEMTLVPCNVQSQSGQTCVVLDSFEVASCDLNAVQSRSSYTITVPDSLVESSCICDEIEFCQQSEQERCAIYEELATVNSSIFGTKNTGSATNIAVDKPLLHCDYLDTLMMDSIDPDINVGRLTNTQKVNLFEMELEKVNLELMKQYPGDVDELTSSENTQ